MKRTTTTTLLLMSAYLSTSGALVAAERLEDNLGVKPGEVQSIRAISQAVLQSKQQERKVMSAELEPMMDKVKALKHACKTMRMQTVNQAGIEIVTIPGAGVTPQSLPSVKKQSMQRAISNVQSAVRKMRNERIAMKSKMAAKPKAMRSVAMKKAMAKLQSLETGVEAVLAMPANKRMKALHDLETRMEPRNIIEIVEPNESPTIVTLTRHRRSSK